MYAKIGWDDVQALKRFDNAFKVLGDDTTKKVMVRALNRVGNSGYVGRGPSVVRTLAKQTGLSRKLIKRAVKPIKANYTTMEYKLVVRGGEISLKHFDPRETKRGVTAKIGGSRKLFAGAFRRGGRWPNRVNTKLGGHVFKRTGAGRLPIEKLKSGVVIPDEMLQGATLEGWTQIINEALPVRVAYELGRASGGIFD